MNKKTLVLLTAFIFHLSVYGQLKEDTQDVSSFSLEEIIQYAKGKSISALRAATRRENQYWRYRTFRSNYNPQLSLNGTFPDFSRTFDEVRQPDGSYDFVPVNINNSSVNLNLGQSIGITGTEFFVQSTLRRFDNFDTGERLYSGNPMNIGLQQPLFTYNQLKWDSRIEPLRFEESKRQYVEDMEVISVEASRRFFDLLDAQISLQIAEKNFANNDTIYRIGEGRYNLGKIAENDLLQLELNVMTSRQQAAEARVALQAATLRLKTYVGLTHLNDIYLELPDQIPFFEINQEIALEEARKNRADAMGFDISQLEARRGVAQARGETGFNANLFATYGLTNRTDGIPSDLYDDPQSSQTVRIGFGIPVMDWGRQRSRVKTAEANQKLVEYTIQQDLLTFEEEIFTQVQQIAMLREQVVISQKTDEVADKRYEISKNRYLIGKISITDMNIALRDKDDAKRAYISSLRNFWAAYYSLRLLTLYDFQKGESLYIEEE